MKVVLDGGEVIDLGVTEATPTIGIVDYSRRETDDYGVTTVVERGFARRMSVRLIVPFDRTDALQRQLAALRATPAQWVADDRFAWLNFRGFYKDFEIDLALPPVSYCTLTVEALAETEALADPGGDPAPGNAASSLQLLQPATVDAAALVASTVPENDYPEWSAGTTYAVGDRVIKAATHRIYESGAQNNVGNDPAGVSGKWTDIGPTNRWAMFDQALGSVTRAANSITVVVDAGAVDALALLDVAGASVRVQAPGYDRTKEPNESGSVTFLDLAGLDGPVSVAITGPGTVEVGTLLIGRLVGLGSTTESPKAGITDFSRKEADEFGDVVVVERAWAKRMSVNAMIRTDALDVVANRIAAVRAKPSLWIGKEGMETLTVYGFFKDFSIAVDATVSTLSLSIEGLSTAGKVEPLTASVDWPDVGDPDGTKPEDNATVGAPEGTDVAGKPAEEVVGQLETQDTQLAVLNASAAQAEIDIANAQATLLAVQADAADTQAQLVTAQNTILAQGAVIQQAQDDITAQGSALVAAQADIIANATSLATLQSTVSSQGATITTLQSTATAQAGSIATLTTQVTAGNKNLIVNGGPENGIVGWAYSSGTLTAQTTRYGTVLAASGTSSSIDVTATAFSVVAGQAYTATCNSQLAGGSSPSLQLQLIWLNSGGAEIVGTRTTGAQRGIHDYANQANRGANAVTGNAPAGAVSALFRAAILNGSGGTSVTALIGQAKAEWGTQWTSYTPDASIMQSFTAISTANGQISSLQTTVSTQGGLISTNATAITTLNGTVSSLSTTVSSQGSSITTLQSSVSTALGNISTLQSTVATQGGQISTNATAITTLEGTVSSLSSTVSSQGSSITTLQTASATQAGDIATLKTRVTAGGGNLLTNTEFAGSSVGWSAGSSSSQSGLIEFGINGAGSSYQVAGTNALTIHQTNTLATGYAEYTQDFPAEPGKIYEFSTWYASHRCLTSYYVLFLNSAQADLGGGGSAANQPAINGGPALSGWSRIGFKTGAAPAGTVLGRVYMRKLATSTGTTDSWAWFLRPQVIETAADAPTPQRYSSGTDRVSIESNGTALSTLNTQYASLSTTVSTQGSTISSQQTAIATINTNVATLTTRVASGSQNLMANGGIDNGLTGWGSGGTLSVGVSSAFGKYLAVTSSSASFYVNSPSVAVDANATYTVSADTQFIALAGSMVLNLIWLNSGGSEISRVQSATRGGHTFDNSNTNRAANAVSGMAPASAVSALVQFQWNGVSGLTHAAARLTKFEAFPTWTPYSSEAAIRTSFDTLTTLNSSYASLSSTVSTQGVTITSQQTAITTLNSNVTTLFGKVGVTIDVNGYMTGWTLNNNGQAGSFVINADYFSIVKPGGGNRTEYSNGVWRVYAGSTLSAWGAAFGSTNQFVRWFGPAQSSLAGCTEANAIEYLKTDGSAYFGGTLSTGTFRNSITGTLLTSPADTILGPFSTNGNNKVVNCSGIYSFTQSYTSGPTITVARTPSFRLTLYRSRDGSAWTQLAQYSYNGSYTATPAQGSESGQLTINIQGSFTYTDTGGTGAQPMYYMLRIDNRTLPQVNGGEITTGTSQRATIVSTE